VIIPLGPLQAFAIVHVGTLPAKLLGAAGMIWNILEVVEILKVSIAAFERSASAYTLRPVSTQLMSNDVSALPGTGRNPYDTHVSPFGTGSSATAKLGVATNAATARPASKLFLIVNLPLYPSDASYDSTYVGYSCWLKA